jgi:hypothetical protein
MDQLSEEPIQPVSIKVSKECHQKDGKSCVHKCYVEYNTGSIVEEQFSQIEIVRILDILDIETPNHFKTPVIKDLYKDKPVFYWGTANFSLYHQMKYGKQPNSKYYFDQVFND